MENIDKGIELTGRTAEDLENNGCVYDIGIVPPKCNEDCFECWHTEFTAMIPDCFKACDCDTCERHEETCCVNKKEECKDKCIMRLA